jgi:2'-5' RNA ligase
MRTSERKRRVFFALWPSEEQQAALASAAQSVTEASGGRVVPALNFHVTLVFVGSVAEVRMPDLFKIAAHVSAAARDSREFGSGPLQLGFDAVEYWRKAKIICATASMPSAAATALSEELKSHLFAAGFAPDIKPFRAHVTLARKVPHGTHDRTMQSVPCSFTDCALVDSRTGPGGSLYSVLNSWPLCAEVRQMPEKKDK